MSRQIAFAWTEPKRYRGLRPSVFCAARLDWFENSRIDELTAEYRRGGIPLAFLNAVKAENPGRVADMRRALVAAIAWQMKTYGNCALDGAKGQIAA